MSPFSVCAAYPNGQVAQRRDDERSLEVEKSSEGSVHCRGYYYGLKCAFLRWRGEGRRVDGTQSRETFPLKSDKPEMSENRNMQPE